MKLQNTFLIIICIVSFHSLQIQAQNAPGLFGHRLIIEGGLSTMQNWSVTRYNNSDNTRRVITPSRDIDIFPLLFSLNYQLQTSYVLTRLSAVGFNTTFARLGYGKDEVAPTLNANIHSFNFTLFYRRYLGRMGSIAPIGIYYQFGPSLMSNTQFFKESIHFYREPETFGHVTHRNLAINFEIGRQTILANGLLFSYGVQSSIVSNLNTDETYKVFGRDLPESNNAHSRIIGHYLFRFKCAFGIGVDVNK